MMADPCLPVATHHTAGGRGGGQVTRPLALDLFCGAGGVSAGLHHAGFDVIGIDVRRQPRYPFPFIQGDATHPPVDLAWFDFVWASPPCQAHTSLRTMHNAKQHADLIPATRALLAGYSGPWCIENVPGADLRYSLMLCGTMFGLGCDGAKLRRHRLFETSFPMLGPQCQHGSGATLGVYGGHVRNRKRVIGVYGHGPHNARRQYDKGQIDFSMADGRKAMGIDWMTQAELSQAIPPAYAAFIGRQAMRFIGARQAVAA